MSILFIFLEYSFIKQLLLLKFNLGFQNLYKCSFWQCIGMTVLSLSGLWSSNDIYI